MIARVPGRRPQVFWEARRHAALTARALGDLARRAGGLSSMQVYSDAAHRASSKPLRPLVRIERVRGPRLVCWQRT